MKLEEFGKAISNGKRIKLLSILSAGFELSLEDCFIKMVKLFPTIHRESVYRYLELLTNVKIIEKRYNQELKLITYFLPKKSLSVDFSKEKIIFIDS